MDNRVEINILLDFYGSLLSEKQKACMEAYYYDDLSLVEIADIDSVTKQAVSDLISRSTKKLYEIEEKLKLYKKSKFIQDKLSSIVSNIEGCKELDEKSLEQLRTELKEISKILL